MPDYKDMLKRQGKGELGYPSTMPQGKPPRDYSDSPLRRPKMKTTHEQIEETSVTMEELQTMANTALDNLNFVLNSLPSTRGRDTAAHYLATHTLWLQQAFREGNK